MSSNRVNTISTRTIYILVIAALVGLVSFASYHIAYKQFARIAEDTSRDRLTLYRAGLRSTLDRVSHLPKVARLHRDTVKILKGELPADDLNQYLKAISGAADSAAIYVLDSEATTVAASNFDTEESFLGNNYRFRKYFTDAMTTGVGRFFAVGVTTNKPGYFMSEAILDEGKPIGVAVVKVEFLKLLADWKNAGENVLISDKDGVIVLASQFERLYKTLREISPRRLSEMQETRKFSGFSLEPFIFKSENSVFDGEVQIDGEPYIVKTVDTDEIGWNLHFLAPLNNVQNSALVVSAIVFLLSGLAVIVSLYLRSKVQQDRLKIIAAEAQRVTLVNTKLEAEVKERKRTEKQLRETQAELIQSSRLAALGQMSAAIVHEVNQPVSAIQMFTASGMLLIKDKRFKEANNVFQEIRKMTERLGVITSDLLVFSRKPVSNAAPINMNTCIDNMLGQYRLEFEQVGVRVTKQLDAKAPFVKGSQVRFEQLIGNLFKNAMQATSGKSEPRISVTCNANDEQVDIYVRDNGEGIEPAIIDQLFDPFFTTKAVGKGVGLGLALSYAIAEEAGGRIYCENNEDGGASFHVKFPLVDKPRSIKQKALSNA